MDLDEVKPYSKETQLGRPLRKVAGPRRRREIAKAKQGECRVCGGSPPNELHHLVSRGQGGSDTEANIVPLCVVCHVLVEERNKTAALALASTLTDAEYAYCVEHYGEAFFERRLGIVYERA